VAVTKAASDEPIDDGAAPGRPAPTRPGAGALGVVLLLTGLAALLLVTLSFSADNTGHSIDGRTATTSQHIDP
jgi:hypothetical protein